MASPGRGVMGYCFDYRHRLCCDGCGKAGGVRKRKCAYRVRASVLDGGYSIPYCSPPALCSDCYKKHGGLRGVHGDRCRDGAAASQAEADADDKRHAEGDLKLRSALRQGDKVLLKFDGEIAVLVDDYEYGKVRWFLDLDDYELAA